MSCGNCMPDSALKFCLTPGVSRSLSFEYQPTFNLTDVDVALFTARKDFAPVNDPDDSTATIRATGSIDAEAHTVTVSLTSEQTSALRSGQLYWWDLTLVDGGEAVSSCSGRFSVSPAITNRRTA